MVFFIIAVLAGALTVLAPCILPLLTVVVGASEPGARRISQRAVVVILSLAASVIVFTLLLKASTLLIVIPPYVWAWISGAVLIVLGVTLIVPSSLSRLPFLNAMTQSGNAVVGAGYRKNGFGGDVLMGVALGPVFSTCSPTYLFIIATVLPASYVVGMVYLAGFVLGLTAVLFAIAYFGQQIVNHLLRHFMATIRIKQGLGVLLLVLGVSIVFGLDKQLESRILDSGFGATIQFEEGLLKRFAPLVPSVHSDVSYSATSSELESVEVTETTADSQVGNLITTVNEPAAEPALVSLNQPRLTQEQRTAMFGNGCFWCVEHDLAELDGVLDVVSGYAGGTSESPDYKNYAEGGHREVVFVTYDARMVSYANLVEHIIKHGDPTDTGGSFKDRGSQYAPALYYENEDEKNAALSVIEAVNDAQVFADLVTLPVLPRVPFYPAEEYHQDYAQKNPLRYSYYRRASGRTAFIENVWGDDLNKFSYSPMSQETMSTNKATTDIVTKYTPTSWEGYVRPSDDMLRTALSDLSYTVTRKNGTERAGTSVLDKNYELGIYVDVISGEPLFSSRDKFDSKTGWPSFVKPISDTAVTLHEDRKLFSTRTEVRSRYADSHLGHVFDDGPTDRGGKRYCMNGAALRFIPKADMAAAGYDYWLPFVE